MKGVVGEMTSPTEKDYSKWWIVTQFDVGRKLGHPDYIDNIDRQLESLREAASEAEKAIRNIVAGELGPQLTLNHAEDGRDIYPQKMKLIREELDQLAERLEAVKR